MSSAVAKQAVETAQGVRVHSAQILSSGQSSHAWLVEASNGRWIARVPVEDSGRRITYRAESFIGQHLTSRGHSVATWTVVNVKGRPCSVSPYLHGRPVGYDSIWTRNFARSLAKVLLDLHTMPAQGFGPLANDQSEARGISLSRRRGVTDRWCHARAWPFDRSSLITHPVMDRTPKLCQQIASIGDDIEGAEQGLIGVVHSDLHQEHLLMTGDGGLAGVLDFGDAFVGAVAWDFGLLNWYYGQQNAGLVAQTYPNGAEQLARGRLLSVAIGLYKAAKNPADKSVEPRLRRCLRSAEAI